MTLRTAICGSFHHSVNSVGSVDARKKEIKEAGNYRRGIPWVGILPSKLKFARPSDPGQNAIVCDAPQSAACHRIGCTHRRCVSLHPSHCGVATSSVHWNSTIDRQLLVPSRWEHRANSAEEAA